MQRPVISTRKADVSSLGAGYSWRIEHPGLHDEETRVEHSREGSTCNEGKVDHRYTLSVGLPLFAGVFLKRPGNVAPR